MTGTPEFMKLSTFRFEPKGPIATSSTRSTNLYVSHPSGFIPASRLFNVVILNMNRGILISIHVDPDLYRKLSFSIHVNPDLYRKLSFSIHVSIDLYRNQPFPIHINPDTI